MTYSAILPNIGFTGFIGNSWTIAVSAGEQSATTVKTGMMSSRHQADFGKAGTDRSIMAWLLVG